MRTRVSPIPTSSVRDGRGASAEITAASRVGTERAGVEPKISEYLAISRTHGEKGAIWEFSLVDPKGKTNPGPPDGTYEARPSARLFLGLLQAHARRRGPV